MAGFLSFFPGLGNIYNGLYLRGVTFFSLVLVCMYTAIKEDQPMLGLAIAFLWLFNILDAWRQANLINNGYTAEPGTAAVRRSDSSPQEKLFSGFLLLVIGAAALLVRYTSITLEWLLDLWPVVLVAIGAWMLWSALQGLRKKQEGSSEDGGEL